MTVPMMAIVASVHPDMTIRFMSKWRPVSHTKCRRPSMGWYTIGNDKMNFIASRTCGCTFVCIQSRILSKLPAKKNEPTPNPITAFFVYWLFMFNKTILKVVWNEKRWLTDGHASAWHSESNAGYSSQWQSKLLQTWLIKYWVYENK